MSDEKEVKKDKKEEKPLFTIEELADKKKIRKSIYYGAMAFKKWNKGKKVTEEQFDKAIEEFLKMSI